MRTCWDLSSASFALGSVHQKSWMPSLKYSNAACYKLHHCFYQRQMEAWREPESSFFLLPLVSLTVLLPAGLTDCHSIGHHSLISQEDIMLTSSSWIEHDSGRVEEDVSPWKRSCSVTCACMKRQQEQTNWLAGNPYWTQHSVVSLQQLACQNI